MDTEGEVLKTSRKKSSKEQKAEQFRLSEEYAEYMRTVDHLMGDETVVENYEGNPVTMRRSFYGHTTIPGVNGNARQQTQPQRLSSKDAKKKREELSNKVNRKSGFPVDREEREMLRELVNHDWGRESWMKEKHGKHTNYQILNEIKEQNYSHFEKLDGIFRDTLATNYMEKVKKLHDLDDDTTIEDKDIMHVADQMEREFFNPVFRLGLSQMIRLQEACHINNGFYRALDNEIARRIMVKTLTHRLGDDQEEAARYKEKLATELQTNNPDVINAKFEEAKKLEKAKQAQMAKQLMLMQLGKLKIISGNDARDTDMPMAAVVAHCSRTLVNTPCYESYINSRGADVGNLSRNEFEEKEKEMWNSILLHKTINANGTVEYKNLAEIKSRGSSTHSFKRRKVNNAQGKEIKRKFNLIGQTGMDVAIGGVGANGVGNEILDFDGTCGHVYGMHKTSKANEAGGYLFGYESDSYGHTNQLGHTHDLLATGEKASSFGCQRTDEVGNKYGGRQADLTQISPENIIWWMNNIDDAVDMLEGEALHKVMDKISGKQLTFDEMNEVWTTIMVGKLAHTGK